jgi:hypothetical protein
MLSDLLVLESGQKTNPHRRHNGGTPNHTAVLAGVGVMDLGRELADVDVTFAAGRTPEQHGNGAFGG